MTAATPPSGSSPCGQPLPLLTDEATEHQVARFERIPSSSLSLTHTVARFPSGVAQRVLDRFRQALEQCPQWEEPGPEGTTYQIRVVPLSSPQLGDQTLAFRFTILGGGVLAQGDEVFIRRGDVIASLSATTGGGTGVQAPGAPILQPLEPRLLEQRARKADAKLADAR